MKLGTSIRRGFWAYQMGEINQFSTSYQASSPYHEGLAAWVKEVEFILGVWLIMGARLTR